MSQISNKPFTTAEDQVKILERRGVICDERTQATLLREGYYAIINGYKAPFLDPEASRIAREDRYVPGTRFDDIHALFRFDRDLRAITFRFLMIVETIMRSLMSYCFCTAHPGTEDYLARESYNGEDGYLLGEQDYERNLNWLIDTLAKHARGVEADPEIGADRSDVRVQYYRDVHGGVPLWVLFTELTFGNLKYFYALMKRDEQRAVCSRVAQTCGATDFITPQRMLDDLEILVEARNICAHEERLWCAKVGRDDAAGFAQVIETIQTYLPSDDDAELRAMLARVAGAYRGRSDVLDGVIDGLGI